MKSKNKKKNYKYDLGSFVEDNGGTIGSLGGILGQAIGGTEGSALSGLGTGIAAGSALGPVGALVGGGIGLIGSLLGANKQKKAQEEAQRRQRVANNTAYNQNINSNLDTINSNPYGNLLFAQGGLVPSNYINIEKGELQIDPTTGKILREYDRINPETGGLYEAHSKKGKDTNNNFVTAEPGTFIITKKKAKDYKDSVENNDKLAQNTILQNIKNAKDNAGKSNKMALGSFVDPTRPPFLNAMNSPASYNYNPLGSLLPPAPNVNIIPRTNPIGISGTSPRVSTGTTGTSSNNTGQGFGNVLSGLANYGPALFNIGQGLFGRVEQQQMLTPNVNPYRNQILNNMPEEVSFDSIRRDVLRNRDAAYNQVRTRTSGSPIARANLNNIAANTNNQLSRLRLDNDLANNQIRSQRASIYSGLGAQDMNELSRVQQLNLGIEQGNQANRAARQNLLNTGLGQLQQTYQSQNFNNQQRENDAMRTQMLYQMFPNLRFYSEIFGGQS